MKQGIHEPKLSEEALRGIYGIDKVEYEYENKIVEDWEQDRRRDILLQELNKALDKLLDWSI